MSKKDSQQPFALPLNVNVTRRQALMYGRNAMIASALAAGIFAETSNEEVSAASQAIVLAFSDPTALYIVDTANHANPQLVVTITTTTAAMQGQIQWTLLERGATQLNQGTTPFNVPANSQQVFTIALGALTPDYFTVPVHVTDQAGTALSTQKLGLGVLYPPVEGVRPQSAFGLAVRAEGDPVISKQIAQKIGVKWTRGLQTVTPQVVNPSPGVFWGETEINTARQEVEKWLSHGITPLGGIVYNMPWNVMPGPNGEQLLSYQNRPKDLVAHTEMVYHSIAPLQDLVKNWELWNEPWVHGWTWKTGTAQDYRDMVKLIWDRVKPEYPDVNLIGGGSVSYQRDIVYAKGSDSIGYIDGSVNHAYGFPDPTQYAMTKTQMKMDKLWSQTHGRAGQWQTELGVATFNFPDLTGDEPLYGVARMVAPTYLLHMLAGAEEQSPVRTFWFALSYDKTFSGVEFNIYDYKTRTPNPAVAAYATMTHFLEECQLIEDIYPEAKSTWGMLFSHPDKRARAALYADQLFDGTYEHQSSGYTGTITVRDALGLKVYDYLGRQLADGRKGQITLEVKPWEVLYFVSNVSPQVLKQTLTHNTTFNYTTPLSITPLSFVKPLDKQSTIDVQVENVTPQVIPNVQLTIQPPAGWQLAAATQHVSALHPGEKRVVRFPVSSFVTNADNRYPVGYSAIVRYTGTQQVEQRGQQILQVTYAPYKTITVDGDLSDWSDVIPVSISRVAADGSTKIYKARTAWDDNNFYFAAEIQDNGLNTNQPFTQNPYGFPFNVDSIQLAFDLLDKKPEDLLAGDLHYEKACATNISHLYVASLAQGNTMELHRQTAPGTNYQTFYPTNAELNPPLGLMNTGTTGTTEGQVKIIRDDTKRLTTYEIAIAWSQLPELQTRLQALRQGDVAPVPFAFSVNDTGAAPALGRSYWTTEAGILESGCYNFAPFWGTGSKATGSRVITRWGFTH